MAASHEIKIARARIETNLHRQALWSVPPARKEAQALLQLLGRNGTTAEAIRELIAIPPPIERVLQGYALENPEERNAIERVIEFRECVRNEFERLLGKPTFTIMRDSQGIIVNKLVTG